MYKKFRLCWIISFMLSFIALVIGASFHGYRMHPEQMDTYKFGVAMGISMISLFIVFLLLGVFFVILDKKKNSKGKKQL